MLSDVEVRGLIAYLESYLSRKPGERFTISDIRELGMVRWKQIIERPPLNSAPINSDEFRNSPAKLIPRNLLHDIAKRSKLSVDQAFQFSLHDLLLLAQRAGSDESAVPTDYASQGPPTPVASPAAPTVDANPEPSHSPDFRSVNWYGQEFDFTPTQAACVKVLWDAWESGTSTLGESSILDSAGSAGSRLRDVFRKGKHPAMGRMIHKVGRDSYQLGKPDSSTSPKPHETPHTPRVSPK